MIEFPQFEVTDSSYTTRYNNYSATQLKPGYWDQNSRNPGSQLPRDGGTHYRQAWDALKNDPLIQHVNIESWNEYDEGSGIYRGNPGPPFIKPGSGNTATDTWSATNDPLEYVKTTAGGARAFNDTPDMNVQILWHNFPTQMNPGEVRDVSVIVRNEGDVSWTGHNNSSFDSRTVGQVRSFSGQADSSSTTLRTRFPLTVAFSVGGRLHLPSI